MKSIPSTPAEIAANAALLLVGVACALLTG
jgi:hypothetical protein